MKISIPQRNHPMSNSVETQNFTPTTPIQEEEVHNGLTRTVSPCSSRGELSSSSSSPLTGIDSYHMMSNEASTLQPQICRPETSFRIPPPNIITTGENTQPPIRIPDLYNEVRVGGRIGKIGLLALAMRYVVEEDMP